MSLSFDEEAFALKKAVKESRTDSGASTAGQLDTMTFDLSRNTTPAADQYIIPGSSTSSSNVTPSKTDEVKSRRASYLRKKRERYGVESSDDDASSRRPVTRRMTRLSTNKNRASTISTHASSKSVKPPQLLDNKNSTDEEIKFMKVEKAASSDSKNVHSLSASSAPSKIGLEHLGFHDPSPPFSQQPLCKYCGNKGYACHNKIYSTYCTKACYDYLQNNKQGWYSGFDQDIMEGVFVKAYNEKRRVELEENHGYYCPKSFELPQCMRSDSMKHAVILGDNPLMCHDLEKHNEGGYKRWLEAKKNYRS